MSCKLCPSGHFRVDPVQRDQAPADLGLAALGLAGEGAHQEEERPSRVPVQRALQGAMQAP